VTETLIPVTRARRLDLIVEGVEQMPPVRADKNRLAEAVYHLVYNAIKFNRPDGKILVRYWSDNGGIRFEVEDTGVGIPSGKLKLLWDPFSQIADPIKRGKEGLGLGLALVSYVIHAHGGRVGVSSQEGVGSTFRFWLPSGGPGRTSSRTASHPIHN
jgi:signal transduction histidine kinase